MIFKLFYISGPGVGGNFDGWVCGLRRCVSWTFCFFGWWGFFMHVLDNVKSMFVNWLYEK